MAQELKAYNVVTTADVNPEVVDNLGCAEWAGYDKEEVDAVLAEKDAEIARLKSDYSAEVEEVCVEKTKVDTLEQALEEKDAEIEALKATERRLTRALWLEKAERAVDKQQYYTECRSDGWVHRVNEQIEEERKCRAMADTFK